MESIASRLKNFVQHKELSTSAFTRALGYKSCEKVARLFRAKSVAKPSVDIVADIANHFPELDIKWLLTGKGEMLSLAAMQPRAEHAIRRQEALHSLLLQSRMAEPEVEEMTV